MMTTPSLQRCIGSIIVLLLFCATARGQQDSGQQDSGRQDKRDAAAAQFDREIAPLMASYCLDCHRGVKPEGGLDLSRGASASRGGESGPAIDAKDPLNSLLWRRIVDGEMPPKEKLPDADRDKLKQWIGAGAKWGTEVIDPFQYTTSKRAGFDWWALQPLSKPEPPVVKAQDQVANPIDAFLLTKLEAAQLSYSPQAAPRVLVRRLHFDLIGLPPTPEVVAAFEKDPSEAAYQQLIADLLASPDYGERWGRHWLDVARFGESDGFERNNPRENLWRYRDWVIAALNQDMPYDEFVRQQIAGDLLNPGDADGVAAVGFLVSGVHNTVVGSSEFMRRLAREDELEEVIGAVAQTFIGLTVNCARCHDHKFDPIPTKDYYALAGIFLSTEPMYGTIKQKYSNNPTDLLPIGPNAAAMHVAVKDHKKKIPAAEKQLAAKRKELKKATESEKLATKTKSEVEERAKIEADALAKNDQLEAESAKSDGETNAADQELAKAVSDLNTASTQVAALKGEVASLEKKVAELKKNSPPIPQYAMTVRDRAKPADTKVAIRGNFRERGDVAPRGFLSAVHVANPPKIDPKLSGRLELAQWITSPENPLTARVMVNRIWHHLLGQGLVESVDNFGIIGKQPSHPLLLDALALRFMQEEWSVKRMIRAIMLSRTYQLSSIRDAENTEIDPDNRLFWRATPRRLEAEPIRDAMLAVSGQLVLERPTGSTVTTLGDQLVRGIPTEKIQPPSNYRSVYLPVVRDYLPELFDLFDFPSPSLVSGRRSVTNIPSQALYLRNSTFVAEQAKYAAKRLLASKEATDDAGRVDLAMRWSLARGVSDAERASALQLVQQIRNTDPKSADRNVEAWAAWFHTLFTTAEFRFLVDVKS